MSRTTRKKVVSANPPGTSRLDREANGWSNQRKTTGERSTADIVDGRGSPRAAAGPAAALGGDCAPAPFRPLAPSAVGCGCEFNICQAQSGGARGRRGGRGPSENLGGNALCSYPPPL
ncbi:hypothetical protein EVAR_53278_1 [Eumeta japonica]|uniref:Uncharacterized protein n=1 Tax=Eumeta variegata TaxID=151549 RepID=A0A4C1YH22_EUMVA|nr:hypothetical protein EVAR_53278_1 [Eumeta japonica]